MAEEPETAPQDRVATRRARQAAAMRANLQRRKAQRRARDAATTVDAEPVEEA